jgi:hypothetical protein
MCGRRKAPAPIINTRTQDSRIEDMLMKGIVTAAFGLFRARSGLKVG